MAGSSNKIFSHTLSSDAARGHRGLKLQNIPMASLSQLWVKITDFGISKRWTSTALKTLCGTAIYKAPELIGLLPRMKGDGMIFTWSIDIWALSAIIHQGLTPNIPFIEVSEELEGSTIYSMGMECSIDGELGELLLDHCAGQVPFPETYLTMHEASPDGIDFVKSLIARDRKERASAADTLHS